VGGGWIEQSPVGQPAPNDPGVTTPHGLHS
jgi:hypothetical protein